MGRAVRDCSACLLAVFPGLEVHWPVAPAASPIPSAVNHQRRIPHGASSKHTFWIPREHGTNHRQTRRSGGAVSLARKHQVWSGQLISIGNTISHMRPPARQCRRISPFSWSLTIRQIMRVPKPRCAVRGRGVLCEAEVCCGRRAPSFFPARLDRPKQPVRSCRPAERSLARCVRPQSNG
jgi:hypothetical protein